MKRKIKGFSFKEIDWDVLGHIEKQDNQSKYIIGLVRKDMGNGEDEVEKLVRKYIEKYLDGKEIKEVEESIDMSGISDILRM